VRKRGTRGARPAPLRRLSGIARACGTDWAPWCRGPLARPLVSRRRSRREPLPARRSTASAALGLRVDLARARLLYGEWLPPPAGAGVTPAISLAARTRSSTPSAPQRFAERGAHRVACDRRAGRPQNAPLGHPTSLTAQEALIARLASQGASNPQIAAQLFISPATVAYHLGKVFAKLRHQLPAASSAPREQAMAS